MPQKDMRIIDRPADSEGVLAPDAPGPVMTGDGDLTYRCGACKTRLLSGVSHAQVCGAFTAVRCPKCGKFNDLPPEDHHHHHH